MLTNQNHPIKKDLELKMNSRIEFDHIYSFNMKIYSCHFSDIQMVAIKSQANHDVMMTSLIRHMTHRIVIIEMYIQYIETSICEIRRKRSPIDEPELFERERTFIKFGELLGNVLSSCYCQIIILFDIIKIFV